MNVPDYISIVSLRLSIQILHIFYNFTNYTVILIFIGNDDPNDTVNISTVVLSLKFILQLKRVH